MIRSDSIALALKSLGTASKMQISIEPPIMSLLLEWPRHTVSVVMPVGPTREFAALKSDWANSAESFSGASPEAPLDRMDSEP